MKFDYNKGKHVEIMIFKKFEKKTIFTASICNLHELAVHIQ